MSERTTIPVSMEVRDRLKQLARKDETWDEFFRRVIKEMTER